MRDDACGRTEGRKKRALPPSKGRTADLSGGDFAFITSHLEKDMSGVLLRSNDAESAEEGCAKNGDCALFVEWWI